MRVEQAIFTSVQRERLKGYQLAATSAGITSEQAKELTLWGPAHDSLWDSGRGSRSINFHPLIGGTYCLSCTSVAGEEYSGRGGGRVYTQMFVLSRELLARFANDPFLILRAMEAAGRLIVFEEVPETLFRLPLVGRCLAAHSECVTDILSEIGATAFDEILSAISSLSSVAVAAKAPLEKLFQAVLQSLSPEERLTLSFTTGLKHSPRRPFKLFAVPCEDSTIRQSQRMSGARIIDLTTAHAA